MSKNFSLPDAMIFDIDGTLFQTETVLDAAFYKSFNEAKEVGLYKDSIPPIEKMYSCLGMVLDDIWDKLVPGASEEAVDFLNERFEKYEMEELINGNGQLYTHVKEVLETLHKKGIRLFVASNGQEDYVKGVVKYCGLEHLIEKSYSAGEFKTTTKVDLVKMILENHGLKNPWMVGDRSSDVEAGKKNGLITVGCDYADFKDQGELKGADIFISDFKEILSYL